MASALANDREYVRFMSPLVREQDLESLIRSGGRFRPRFEDSVIMHLDVKGFTSLTEKLSDMPEGAQEVTHIMNEIYSELINVVKRYRGRVEDFAGDAMLIEWDDDSLAVAAGLEMQQLMEDYSVIQTSKGAVKLGMRVGINKGKVLKAKIGDNRKHKLYTLGRGVDLAKYIEGKSEVGGVRVESMVHEGTVEDIAYRRGKGHVYFGQRRHNLFTPFRINFNLEQRLELAGEDFSASIDQFSRKQLSTRREYMERLVGGRNISETLAVYGEDSIADFSIVTSMFCKVYGLSDIIQELSAKSKGAKESSLILNTLYSRINAIVEPHGGFIEDFRDDSILIHWGAHYSYENNENKAALSALKIQEMIEKDFSNISTSLGQRKLGISIGINTGKTLVTKVGGNGVEEYTIMGDSVNMAKRVQMASHDGEIYVSGRVYNKTSPFFSYDEDLDYVKLKGKSGKHKLYRVIKQERDFLGHKVLSKTGLRGRKSELSLIARYERQILRGNDRLMVIVGEAGSGKSRLEHEYEKRSDRNYIRTGFTSITRSPLSAFRHSFREYFGDSDIKATMRELGMDDKFLGYVAEFLDTSIEGAQTVAEPQARKNMMYAAALDFFEKRGGILVIDDAHLADDESIGLIKYLSRNAANFGIRLLTRPGYEKRYEFEADPKRVIHLKEIDRLSLSSIEKFKVGDDPRTNLDYRRIHESEHVVNSPSQLRQALRNVFNDEPSKGIRYYNTLTLRDIEDIFPDSCEIIKETLGEDQYSTLMQETGSLNRTTLVKILDICQGNPFKLEEYARSLDIGYDVRELGAKPEQLFSVVQSGVRSLGPIAKRVMQYISGFGYSDVRKEILGEALGIDISRLGDELERLCDRGIISETEPGTFSVKHHNTIDAMYDSMTEKSKQRFHNTVAELYEKHYSGREEEVLEQLVYHYQRTKPTKENIEKLLHYSKRSRQANRKINAIESSIETQQRLVDILKKQGEKLNGKGADRARFAEVFYEQAVELERLLTTVGRYDEAIRLCEDAEEIISQSRLSSAKKREMLFARVAGRARIKVDQKRYDEALDIYHQIEGDISKIRDGKRLWAFYVSRGGAFMNKKLYDKASADFDKAESVCEKNISRLQKKERLTPDEKEELDFYHKSLAIVYNNLGTQNMWQNQYNSALDYYEKALFLLDKLGEKDRLTKVHNNIGVLFYSQGKKEQALVYFINAVRFARESGSNDLLITYLGYLGYTYAELARDKKKRLRGLGIESYEREQQIIENHEENAKKIIREAYHLATQWGFKEHTEDMRDTFRKFRYNLKELE